MSGAEREPKMPKKSKIGVQEKYGYAMDSFVHGKNIGATGPGYDRYYPTQTKPPRKPPRNPPNRPMNVIGGALGPVNPTPANQISIEDKWAGLTEWQIAQRKAQHDAAVGGYEQQRTQANQEYYGMKNQATVSRAMQEKMRKENMINMGMSGGGGTSRTYQQRNTNNLNNQLGGITKQQQDFSNNIDFALGTAGMQYDADVLGITAQNAASVSTERAEYDRWKAGFDASGKDALVQRALALLKAKLITKDQARTMTGLDL